MDYSEPFICWVDSEENPQKRLVLEKAPTAQDNKWTLEQVMRRDAMGQPVWSTIDTITWPLMCQILNGVIPAAQ